MSANAYTVIETEFPSLKSIDISNHDSLIEAVDSIVRSGWPKPKSLIQRVYIVINDESYVEAIIMHGLNGWLVTYSD